MRALARRSASVPFAMLYLGTLKCHVKIEVNASLYSSLAEEYREKSAIVSRHNEVAQIVLSILCLSCFDCIDFSRVGFRYFKFY